MHPAPDRVFMKHAAQVLALNNERFMVPEVVFCPRDIGLQQGGLAEVLPARRAPAMLRCMCVHIDMGLSICQAPRHQPLPCLPSQ